MDEKKDHPNEESCVRKQRRKRQKALLTEVLLDYAKNSTLHGLRYIAERGLSVIEKIFWLVTFGISFGLCFYLIYDVYIKWITSPVIVSFNEHIESVGKVPFPSVTICPQIKSISSRYNYSYEYEVYLKRQLSGNYNRTDDKIVQSMKKLEDIALICHSGPLLSMRNMSNSRSIYNLYEVSPHINEVLQFCYWRNTFMLCDEIFKPVLTTEGYCFNFNALAADEIFDMNQVQREYIYLNTTTESRNWTVKDGYLNYDSDSYPRRGRENGAVPDLQVILKERTSERDGLCNILNRGYKVYIQHPGDVPQSSLYYYAASARQLSSIALKFNMITTADSLKDYSPDVRQCYFPRERPLRYFKIYTPNNCRLECQSNYTFKQCGCAWFHMPHNDSRSICSYITKNCVIDAQDRLAIEELKAEESDSSTSACKCFPDCHSISYDAEILKTYFDFRTYSNAYGQVHHFGSVYSKDFQFSSIEVYFKEPRFVSMRRSELFGLADFMANCGGLLGLFLGFSFLSLVEIFYFITIRLFCTLKRDLKEEKRTDRKSWNSE